MIHCSFFETWYLREVFDRELCCASFLSLIVSQVLEHPTLLYFNWDYDYCARATSFQHLYTCFWHHIHFALPFCHQMVLRHLAGSFSELFANFLLLLRRRQFKMFVTEFFKSKFTTFVKSHLPVQKNDVTVLKKR